MYNNVHCYNNCYVATTLHRLTCERFCNWKDWSEAYSFKEKGYELVYNNVHCYNNCYVATTLHRLTYSIFAIYRNQYETIVMTKKWKLIPLSWRRQNISPMAMFSRGRRGGIVRYPSITYWNSIDKTISWGLVTDEWPSFDLEPFGPIAACLICVGTVWSTVFTGSTRGLFQTKTYSHQVLHVITWLGVLPCNHFQNIIKFFIDPNS